MIDLKDDRRVAAAMYMAILGAQTAGEVQDRINDAVKILHDRDAAQGLTPCPTKPA